MHARTSLRWAGTAIAVATTLTLVGTASGCGSDDDTTTSTTFRTDAAAGTVSDTWVKAARSGMTGAFGVLENDGSDDVRLESVSTDAAAMAELHETVDDGSGGTTMRPKEGGFTVDPGRSHELEPGGDHIMLMRLTRALTPGEKIALTLHFADGSTETVTALVKDFNGGEEKYAGDGSLTGGMSGATGSGSDG